MNYLWLWGIYNCRKLFRREGDRFPAVLGFAQEDASLSGLVVFGFV